MENGLNVSDMLDDEINIMLCNWPETKAMLMKGNLPLHFFNYIIIVFYISKFISKLTLYVFITEMAEYTGKQQQEEEDMDIQNISTQELIPSEEDEDIHDFYNRII